MVAMKRRAIGAVLLSIPLAVPIAAIAVPVGTASASGGSINATKATITCSGVSGKVAFQPALTNTAIASEKITFTESETGCTPSVAVTVTQAEVKATITVSLANGCSILNDTSTFGTSSKGTIAWETSPALKSERSTFGLAPVHFSSQDNFEYLGWSFSSVGGSFQGPNHGEYDEAWAQSPTSVSAAVARCMKTKGLKSLVLATPSSGPFFSLGGPNPE